MDKSEGTDFLSKTFGSLSETVAKWYHTGHKKINVSSLKKARNERLAMLGNKVYHMLQSGKVINKDVLKEEYQAIIQINAQITIAEEELEALQAAASKTAAKKPASAAKKSAPAPAKKAPAAKKNTKKPATAKVASKKTTAKTKKPAKRK